MPGLATHIKDLKIYGLAFSGNHNDTTIERLSAIVRPIKINSRNDCATLDDLLYCAPITKKIESPKIPLPSTRKANKSKYMPISNVTKSIATCAKNRKNRKKRK